MRILFLGDVVGRSGREAINERLPNLVKRWKLDFVAINGENAAPVYPHEEQTANPNVVSLEAIMWW